MSLLKGLEQKDFFYIVSAGDPKASAGQAELLSLFDADGALAEGNNANFITFTLGATLAEGQSSGGDAGEHMTSFDYAYKLEAVRDWLFAQSK